MAEWNAVQGLVMFKRNQVEEAIINIWGPEPAKHAAHLRSQIKRLLDTDRSLGRNKRSTDPERANFAFYSNTMPGKGRDNWFSDYEAFALLTGLRLMRHGWPQRFAVTLLRQVRERLEKEHSRIANQDPAVLFDNQLIMQQAKPGTIVVDNSDPVFVGIISTQSDGAKAAMCRGQESLIAFLTASREMLATAQGIGRTLTSLEVASSAHILANALAKISLRNRGRSTP
jgi:hypothetical protein